MILLNLIVLLEDWLLNRQYSHIFFNILFYVFFTFLNTVKNVKLQKKTTIFEKPEKIIQKYLTPQLSEYYSFDLIFVTFLSFDVWDDVWEVSCIILIFLFIINIATFPKISIIFFYFITTLKFHIVCFKTTSKFTFRRYKHSKLVDDMLMNDIILYFGSSSFTISCMVTATIYIKSVNMLTIEVNEIKLVSQNWLFGSFSIYVELTLNTCQFIYYLTC